MAKAPKKQLNEEVAYYIKGLKTALKFDKNAMVAWHGGRMIIPMQEATIHIPCNFTVTRAVRVSDLVKALDGCTTQTFSIAEQNKEVTVSWGRRRATLATVDKATLLLRPADVAAGVNDIPAEFTAMLQDTIKDLDTHNGNEDYGQFAHFYDEYLYWTNGNAMAQIKLPCYMPHLMFKLKDLKNVVSADTSDSIIAVWWSGFHSVSFYMQSGTIIQISPVDASVVKYPKKEVMESLFASHVDDAVYELNDEHFEAIAYVGGFADNVIYIHSSGCISTHDTPDQGTFQSVDGLPIDLRVSSDVAKVGGFLKATQLIKRSSATSRVGFFTKRENVVFCFAKYKPED